MSDAIDIGRLEALAAWHRLNAEHAGSPWVWEARLRTAEDLERRAAELRTRQVQAQRPAHRMAGEANAADKPLKRLLKSTATTTQQR
jgi:hypothetical protein